MLHNGEEETNQHHRHHQLARCGGTKKRKPTKLDQHDIQGDHNFGLHKYPKLTAGLLNTRKILCFASLVERPGLAGGAPLLLSPG